MLGSQVELAEATTAEFAPNASTLNIVVAEASRSVKLLVGALR